jgi:GH24 family phage-related lysozyme (muramidase)
MTFATVRAATQHAIRQGHLTPHQLAALGRLDESLTAEQRREFTELWRAQGSPAAPVPEPAWLPSARKIIKEFEGLRLQAYPDAGAWAIGWGSTTISGKVVREGQSITQAQADAQLDADLKRFHEALVRAIPAVSSWQPNRIAALLSWTYNLGVGAMQNSTLRKRILAGEDPAVVVAAELPRWNKSGGTPLAGLTRRRKAEVELFVGRQLQQAPPAAPPVAPVGGLDPRGTEESGMVGPAKKAPVKPGDSYLLVNDRDQQIEAYDHTGKLLWKAPCLARGQGADNDWRTRNSDTPPGLYKIGQIYKDYERVGDKPAFDATLRSYGWYSFDMIELENQEAKHGRAGIMLHGGGTACGWPGAWAPKQRLHSTFGCLRMHNIDLRDKVLPLTKKGTVYIGVHQER